MSKRLAGILLVLISMSMPALAGEVATEDVHFDQRLAALESEVDWLRCRLKTCSRDGSSCGNAACKQAGCYAGTGLVFVRPHFKESFQYSQTNIATGQQTLHPFSFDYDVTPRAWLGIRTSSGLGLHVDYWQYHHSSDPVLAVSDGTDLFSAHATTVIFPATILADDAGDILSAASSLQSQILNLVATYHATLKSTQVRAGMGLRYVLLEQELQSSVVDGLGVPQGVLNWSRRFEGLGPTALVEARRRLGSSGLNLIAGGGGGLLFGSKTLDRFVFGDVGAPPASPFLRLDDADEVVGIGELNFGLEWVHRFKNRTQLAIQGRYEGQLWAEAGAPTLGFLGFEGFGVFVELTR